MTPLETPQRIEPVRLDETTEAIADVIADLSAAAARLGLGLHPRTAANLADLVRMDAGLLGSETPKGAVSLRFPMEDLDVLFPRLFPET